MNTNQVFEENKKIVYRLAWSAYRRYDKIPLEEYVSEGIQQFYKCIDRYDKEKSNNACFSTYLYASVRGYLSNLAKKKSQEGTNFIGWDFQYDYEPKDTLSRPSYEHNDPSMDTHSPSQESILIFKQTLESLSDDAKFVVNMILQSDTPTYWQKSTVRNQLRKVWHGDEIQNRISKVFKEIKGALQTL